MNSGKKVDFDVLVLGVVLLLVVEVGVVALHQFLGGINIHLAALVQAVGDLGLLRIGCHCDNQHQAHA